VQKLPKAIFDFKKNVDQKIAVFGSFCRGGRVAELQAKKRPEPVGASDVRRCG
jgi:hypothetical protein